MIIDLILFLLVVFAAFKGFRKGLVGAVFSFAAFFVGLAAAVKLSALVAEFLRERFDHPGPWWPVLAFILVFMGISLLMRMLASMVERSLEAVAMGWANKLAGFVLFAVLYVLIFSVLLFYYDQVFTVEASAKAASGTYPYIKPWGEWSMEMVGKVIPAFKDLFKDMQQFFEQAEGRLKKTA